MRKYNEYAYDNKCKKVLCDKQILAFILSVSMKEYTGLDIKDIVHLIEPNIQCEEYSPIVFPRENEYVDEDGNKIIYDKLFCAKFPNSNNTIDTIINIEMQNDAYLTRKDNRRYTILKRGIFYAGKMLVKQKGVTFTNNNYHNLLKVNTIWICARPPKYKENSIQRYTLKEENVVGKLIHENIIEYDMLNISIINLGRDGSVLLLEPLNELFVKKHTSKEIFELLKDTYGIEVSEETKGEIEEMCNFSKGIFTN